MTKLSQIEKYIAVTGIPEEAMDFKILPRILSYTDSYFDDRGDQCFFEACLSLPEGNWRILGRLNELTEEHYMSVYEDGIRLTGWDKITESNALILSKE